MHHRRRIPLHLLGRFAPVFLVVALTDSRAPASCGDYVHVLPTTAATDRIDTRAGEPATEPGVPHSPFDARKCGEAPPNPAPPPPPPTAPSRHSHDAALFDPPATEPSATASHPTDSAGSPRHIATSIFHPPRP